MLETFVISIAITLGAFSGVLFASVICLLLLLLINPVLRFIEKKSGR